MHVKVLVGNEGFSGLFLVRETRQWTLIRSEKVYMYGKRVYTSEDSPKINRAKRVWRRIAPCAGLRICLRYAIKAHSDQH